MSQQLALAYPADYVGKEAWERHLEVLRAAVAHLTAKEVAHILDVNKTHLSDALFERDRKVWHGHWTHVVQAMLSAKADDASRDLLRAIADAGVASTPFVISDVVELTPEEEVAALRRELAAFGAAGKAAIDRVKKRGRK